ncbi:hypothetical protein EYF80_033142 [Liparis tanakae]|uniref:Uncharacterized protein n=1 Tax=Liparis tanakae TaxID=230148 RepID=A0A4Z2GTZ1_9TELE|nr:hypothetical protein EYF80_033142 [Liparis tanakae]
MGDWASAISAHVKLPLMVTLAKLPLMQSWRRKISMQLGVFHSLSQVDQGRVELKDLIKAISRKKIGIPPTNTISRYGIRKTPGRGQEDKVRGHKDKRTRVRGYKDMWIRVQGSEDKRTQCFNQYDDEEQVEQVMKNRGNR